MRNLFLILGLLFASSAAAQPYCDIADPTVCAEVVGTPVFETKVLGNFKLQMNQPIQSLGVEFMWETEDKELAVITVPQKVTQTSDTGFEVNGVLMMIEGRWVIELKPVINGKSTFIVIPVQVLESQPTE